MDRAHWNLMGARGVVLFYFAAKPESTMRQAAEEVGLTERRVAQLLHDLAEAGMLTVVHSGRRNRYVINPKAAFPDPVLSDITVGDFLRVLEDSTVIAE